MKKHKIRNVDIDICCCEQKIAYNFLFSWSINAHNKEYAYKCVKDEIYGEIEGKITAFHPTNWNRYDVEYILDLFYRNFDKYCNLKYKIFSSYKEIGEVIY